MVQLYMIYLNQYVGLLLKDKDIIYRNQIFNKSAEYSYENNGQNVGALPLTSLMGKIILIVDKSNNSFIENNKWYCFKL